MNKPSIIFIRTETETAVWLLFQNKMLDILIYLFDNSIKTVIQPLQKKTRLGLFVLFKELKGRLNILSSTLLSIPSGQIDNWTSFYKGDLIEQVKEDKLSGLSVDHKLSETAHINNVVEKWAVIRMNINQKMWCKKKNKWFSLWSYFALITVQQYGPVHPNRSWIRSSSPRTGLHVKLCTARWL